MKENYVLGVGIAAALLLAVGAAAIVGMPTLIGLTPLGVAIYTIVGLGLPQAVLAWQEGSWFRGVIGGVALAGGFGALGYGLVQESLTTPHDDLLGRVLLGVVVVAVLASAARSFYSGYQTAAE